MSWNKICIVQLDMNHLNLINGLVFVGPKIKKSVTVTFDENLMAHVGV